MGDEKQTVELYDFLYKDISRIYSYYAQVFKGTPKSFESIKSSSSSKQSSGKASVKFLSGQTDFKEDNNETFRSISDPNDVVTTDILSHLVDNGFINENYQNANHGELIIARGSLLLLDKTVLKFMDSSFTLMTDLMKVSDANSDNHQQTNFLKVIISMLKEIPLQSAFALKTSQRIVVGNLNEDYLAEPISSYYLKHSAQGIPKISIIGIKENSENVKMDDNSMFGWSQKIWEAFSQMVFPRTSIKVTPIAIFRTLPIGANSDKKTASQ